MPRKRAFAVMERDTGSEGHLGDGVVPDLARYFDETAQQDDQLPVRATDQRSPDGQVHHLGSDLPVGSGFPTSDDPKDQLADPSQAYQEAASSQLRSEAANTTMQTRARTLPNGKKQKLSVLPKISRKPQSVAVEATQRRLPGQARPPRPSAFDIDSLRSPQVVLSRRAEDNPQFSPIRLQKKAKRAEMPVTETQTTNDNDSRVLRRSMRNQTSLVISNVNQSSGDVPDRAPSSKASRNAMRSSREMPEAGHSDEQARDEPIRSSTKDSDLPADGSSDATGSVSGFRAVVQDQDVADDSIAVEVPSKRGRLRKKARSQQRKQKTKHVAQGSGSHTDASSAQEGVPNGESRAEDHEETEASSSAAEAENDPQDGDADSLLGQWIRLRELRDKARKVRKRVREEGDIHLDDIDVVAIMASIHKAEGLLTKARNEAQDDSQRRALTRELESVLTRTRKLCEGTKGNSNEGEKGDSADESDEDSTEEANGDSAIFDDQNKTENIYGHLLPRLVELLAHTSSCYMAMDLSKVDPRHSVTIEHLRTLVKLTGLIARLAEAVRKRYKKPRQGLNVVKSVLHGLVVPLRDIDKTFRQHLASHQQVEALASQRAQRQAEAAARARSEEARYTAEAAVKRLRRKWRSLHEERRFAGPPILNRRELQHLSLREHAPESDFNGEAVERIEVFRPRVGPPPALVEEARQVDWTDDEVHELCEGLKQYSGELVFERIFRRYCGRGGPLNRFNVTEIVTMAADAKEWYECHQMDEGGRVEDWVRAIPVWTKPHILLGKENEGEEEDGDM